MSKRNATMRGTATTITAATAVAGILDIVMAFLSSSAPPAQVLRSVASGPFGSSMRDGAAAEALLGLAVHFSIMTVMVAVFVIVASKRPRLLERPLASGLGYGLLLYLVMYWIVLPLRWPDAFPVTQPAEVGKALFAHLLLVGAPIALITARFRKFPAAG